MLLILLAACSSSSSSQDRTRTPWFRVLMAFCGYALYLPGVLLLYSGTITIFLRFSLIKPFFSLGFWVWFERTLFLTSSLGIAWFLYWTWARRTRKFGVGGLIRWYHHLLCSRVPCLVAALRPFIVKIRISVFLYWRSSRGWSRLLHRASLLLFLLGLLILDGLCDSFWE